MTKEQAKIVTRAEKTGIIYVKDKDTCPEIHFCKPLHNKVVFDGSFYKCKCGRI